MIEGPDGSLHRSSHGRLRRKILSGETEDSDYADDDERYTDWDDCMSVRRIVPHIHEALEASIQQSMQLFANFDDNDNNGNNKNGHKNRGKKIATATPVAARIIRRIEVVTGRGFYTVRKTRKWKLRR